ncbi:Ribose ABC transport system, periplasmic ribose-binding protein RbsB [Pseudomonas chlororaphis subsp. aurantiaca]|nr:Ribose ABC transport system, periplasmic ribose-binding protein RbsB [Pseudomonas chlororaphis subsp. aurantiaca]
MKLPFAGRLLAVAVLAAASATLPLSSAFAETPEKPKVALVMKSLANEFFLTMEDGAKAYQKTMPPISTWSPTASRMKPTPPTRSVSSSR